MMEHANRITISNQRYLWALQRAGLNVDTYIKGHPKSELSLWLSGEKLPTLKQLEDFAKSVNVPFGYLFLDEAPREEIPFPVFRGAAGRYDHFDLNVYDTVNIIKQRQEWLEDYLLENEIETCSLIGRITRNTPIANAVELLRNTLELDAEWASEELSSSSAVNKLTDMMAYAGIFVAYNGIVGNNTHRPIKVSECRGFALVNKIAPYVFVNSQDAKTAQLFTLVHEMAHLMLGISAGHADDSSAMPSDDLNEKYCDAVAAEFLVPAAILRRLWNGDLKRMSRHFKVSELVIARRAHDLRLMSEQEYKEFWQNYQIRNSSIEEKKLSRGGDFYPVCMKRVGWLFATHVRNAVNSNQLSYVQAYRLTGLYGKTYDSFMSKSL